MISRFTERNEFSGHTWQIKTSSTVRIRIKGTSTSCEYVIEIQEFGWIRWRTKKSTVCRQSLPSTIEEALRQLHDFFDAHDDFDVPRSLMEKERKIVMNGLEKSTFYRDEIAPVEASCDDQ